MSKAIISGKDQSIIPDDNRVLYDLAKGYYDAGDYRTALEKIDEASHVPGYSNDVKLMELNREIGKYCRRISFRNIQFNVKQFKSQHKQFKKWSDHNEYVLDLSRRYLKIDAMLKVMKVTGNTTVVSEAQDEARRILEYEIEF